jgi:hypothetical protein
LALIALADRRAGDIFPPMKRKKGKRPAFISAARAPHARTKDRRIVPVDQGPIRRKAASECSRAMARLERARGEWKRFEHEDKPAFGRWMAATFGAMLTRLRDAESLIREKEILIQEIEMEMTFGGSRSYRAAYAKVMHRRENPAAARDASRGPEWAGEEADGNDPGFNDAGPDLISGTEQEVLFEEFVRTFMGINPDKLSDAQYEQMFRDFKTNVFDRISGESPPPREMPPQPQRAEPKPDQVRIKEIYRVLVRRLHPDVRADKDAEVSALWHEVQEAYGDGDLERLEMLLALTDIQSNTAGGHTSLFQMHAVLAELRRAFNALHRSLRSAQKDPAWNFARTSDRRVLQARIERELESDLAVNQRQLREMESLISSWARPPKPRKQFATRGQAEFSF